LQKRLADSGHLTLPQVLEIARQAGSALAAAHAAGIVHRDLKPENLFLVPERAAPGGERVKILDFGIAKIVRSSGSGGTLRTQTGLIMGSPAYMSPEQCKDSADVDLRSDIYSFATIIYEMLTGRTPYVAASGTEMLVMHLTGTPRPVRELIASVPAHVEAAIARGLSRARDDRFENIAEFLGALRGGVGATALLRPSSSSEELPAVGESPVSGVGRTVAAPAITTFSRVTGEVGAEVSDDVLLAATRTRRWPFFALGGAAVGLALFLIVRPSHDSAPRAPIGTPGVAATAAAVADPALPARQEPRGNAAGVLPSRPDGGVAAPAVAGVPAVGKSAHPEAPPAADEARPAGKRARVAAGQTSPKPAGKKRRSDDQWFVH